MKKWGSLDVAGRAGQHRKPAADRIGRPTKQRSRNQNGCAARSADKNVGVAGLEARSTRAMKSSRAAKNLKRCNTERRKKTDAPGVDTSVDAARTSASHECVRHRSHEIFAAIEGMRL